MSRTQRASSPSRLSPAWRRSGAGLAAGLLLALGATSAQSQSRYTLHVDPMDQAGAAMANAFRRSGGDAFARAALLDISSTDRPASGETRKRNLVERWEDVAVDEIANRGFDEQDVDEVARQGGLGGEDEFRERLVKSLPFASQDTVRERMADVHLLTSEGAVCDGRRGLVLAVVLGIYPEKGRADDYGSVMVIVMGMLECGRGARAHEFVTAAVDGATTRVREYLNGGN